MTAAPNFCHPNFLAIQASVEADLARPFLSVIDGLLIREGPNTQWLRANSAAIRKAHAEMIEENTRG